MSPTPRPLRSQRRLLTRAFVARLALSLAVSLAVSLAPRFAVAQSARPYPDRVEIRRTAYGVPHIQAEDLGAFGYAMAWVQLEDYGARVAHGLVRARGQLARYYGRDSLDRDFDARLTHQRAAETWLQLQQETRAVYDGFAQGVNDYVQQQPGELPTWMPHDFTGRDVAALWMEQAVPGAALNWADRARRLRERARQDSLAREGEGSNAWAFAPSRTRSGRAILLRNPHLDWSAGYYEAHVTIPGVMDFYGDFRIGNPALLVGGFNQYLGFATTNNNTDLEALYALEVDSLRTDHYLLDGESHPLQRVDVTAEYRNGTGLSSEVRTRWRTHLGPVVERADGKVYIVRWPSEGEFRKGEQFLRMMRARNLEEWKDAMRLRAHTTSNLTYADAKGNIFYVWNATVPRLPHPSGGDSIAIPVRTSAEMWRDMVPFDSLPQLLNPPGGYIQQSNDPFHYTNLNAIIDSTRFASNFSRPALGFRTQLALRLVTEQAKMSLEDVMRLKHSYRMLAGERFADDLLSAVRASSPAPAVATAAEMLGRWDRTTAPDSRGGVLFEVWYNRHLQGGESMRGLSMPERMRRTFATPWTSARPNETPDGLADPARAAADFAWAVDEVTRRHGRPDVAWGEVHRVRRGTVDAPVGGCTGALGCFRVLQFSDAPDGKRVARGGDGWVLAVEFTPVPRAFTILAYGESARADSPYFDDQAAMFARGEMKRVLYTAADVEKGTIRRYRPGR
ncbi:MAG: penicillin acylase family protein [Gemmatimonadaceae bacterium]|nr:penicillin acylase family protein [Gemmatimonadaceae bacterium]